MAVLSAVLRSTEWRRLSISARQTSFVRAYGFEDAQGGGTGFASIHLQGDKIMVLKQDFGKQEYQPLQEGSKLFTELTPSASAPIKLGHIYLVRIADKKDKASSNS